MWEGDFVEFVLLYLYIWNDRLFICEDFLLNLFIWNVNVVLFILFIKNFKMGFVDDWFYNEDGLVFSI